jgi:hypothetical protein
VCHFSLHPPLVLLGYPMSNSGSLGTATAEPATMNRVSLSHEKEMDSKREDREGFNRHAFQQTSINVFHSQTHYKLSHINTKNMSPNLSLSLFWARWIQFTQPYSFKIHFNIILLSIRRTYKWSLLFMSSNQNMLFPCCERMAKEWGVQSSRNKRFFFSIVSRPVLGPTQPPVQWVLGALSPGVKQHGHEADHSLPSSAKIKNGGAMSPLAHTPSWHNA